MSNGVKCWRCGATEPEVASAAISDECCIPLCRPCGESAADWHKFYVTCGSCGVVEDKLTVNELKAQGWTLPPYPDDPDHPITVEEIDAIEDEWLKTRLCPTCTSQKPQVGSTEAPE